MTGMESISIHSRTRSHEGLENLSNSIKGFSEDLEKRLRELGFSKIRVIREQDVVSRHGTPFVRGRDRTNIYAAPIGTFIQDFSISLKEENGSPQSQVNSEVHYIPGAVAHEETRAELVEIYKKHGWSV